MKKGNILRGLGNLQKVAYLIKIKPKLKKARLIAIPLLIISLIALIYKAVFAGITLFIISLILFSLLGLAKTMINRNMNKTMKCFKTELDDTIRKKEEIDKEKAKNNQ